MLVEVDGQLRFNGCFGWMDSAIVIANGLKVVDASVLQGCENAISLYDRLIVLVYLMQRTKKKKRAQRLFFPLCNSFDSAVWQRKRNTRVYV